MAEFNDTTARDAGGKFLFCGIINQRRSWATNRGWTPHLF